jgi:serine/threonine-protein kinase
MGQVWRGLDIALHRPVAVKVLRAEYTGDPTFLARFRAEAQHAASISHPNIAAVFDYGEEIAQDGTGETLAYLVMELVEGEPLSALVAREGPLDTPITLSLLRQTAFGLGEAHRAGMVHRDVKPGNILVRPDGSVKITDFGIAWSARSVALTRTGQVIGTPQYLSPEQAEGLLASPASDVYALGLIGYECLTGRPAFEGDNPVTIALKQVRQDPEPLPGELPEGVRGLIGRALAKDPERRFPDGAAFVGAVDDLLAGRPVPAAASTVAVGAVTPKRTPGDGNTLTRSVARPPASPRRGRAAMVLLPLLGLLVGAGIAVGLVQALSDGTPPSTANAAEQREAGSIVLAAADYVGRPIDEVAERLAALGLNVQPRPEARDDVVPERVTGIDPTGQPLEPQATVVVTYAVPVQEDGNRGDSRRPDAPARTGTAVGADRVTERGDAGTRAGATSTGGTPDGDASSTLPGSSPSASESTASESTGSESAAPTETRTSENSSSPTTSAPSTSTTSDDDEW